MNKDEVAQKIADAIERDISGRKGIGDEWDCIDGNTKSQMKDEWFDIIFYWLRELS